MNPTSSLLLNKIEAQLEAIAARLEQVAVAFEERISALVAFSCCTEN